MPMSLAGVNGQPVDAFKFYEDSVYESSTGANVVIDTYQNLDLLNLLITIGAVVLAIGIVASLVNAAISASAREQRRARPVARRHPRVAGALAAAAAQLRRGPRRAQRRADARRPRGRRAPPGAGAAQQVRERRAGSLTALWTAPVPAAAGVINCAGFAASQT